MSRGLFRKAARWWSVAAAALVALVAKEFARAGSLVAITDRRNRDKAEAIVAVLEKSRVRSSSHAVSVGDRQQVNDVFAAAA